MHSLGINGEEYLGGNRLTRVHLEKWPLKRSVCVYVCVVMYRITSYVLNFLVVDAAEKHSPAVFTLTMLVCSGKLLCVLLSRRPAPVGLQASRRNR